MKLWLVQSEHCDYDQHESFVVVAESADDAFREACWGFVSEHDLIRDFHKGHADQGDIEVMEFDIGGFKCATVIHASFNAG